MSGGWLEGDVLWRGEQRTRDGAPAVVTYDDGAPGEGVGPGYNGVAEVCPSL